MIRRIPFQIAPLVLALFVAFALGACASGELESGEEGENDGQNQGTTTNQGETDADAGSPGDEDDVLVINSGDPSDVGDVGNGNANSQPGNECSGNSECSGADVCARTTPDGSGDCVAPEDSRLDGEACTDPAQCTSGLCYDGRCTRSCDGPGQCHDGWDCDDLGDGQFCSPPPCSSSHDCAIGQVCAVSATDSGGVETVCLPDNSAGQPGQGCSDHDECASRYCLDGMCSAPCVEGAHCDSVQFCDVHSVELGGTSEQLDMCIPHDGTPCSAPGDCEDPDRTCNMPTFDSGGSINGASCGLTNAGQGSLGSSCDGNHGCESNLCRPYDDGQSGECSVFCEESDTDCGSDQVCARLTPDIGMCSTECMSNNECDGGDVCVADVEPGGEVESFCANTFGDGETGEECSGVLDCESRFCLISSWDEGVSCENDSHCSHPDSECRCPPGNDNCLSSERACLIVESRCSKLCDPANGDADCDTGGHEMTVCDENVRLMMDSGEVHEVPACGMEPPS